MSDVTTKDDVKPFPIKVDADGSAVATFIQEQQESDQRLGRDTEDDDDKGTAGAGESQTERSRSARRRERARRAREEREDEVQQLRAAFGTQQQLIDTLFTSQGQQSLVMLEGEAEKAKMAFAEAERRYAAAIEKGEGASAAEAQRVMANATTYYNNVALQHTNLTRKLAPENRQPQQQTQQQGGRIQMTDRGKALMEKFLDDHPFIDPKKNDATSVAIRAIEARVAANGGDPNRQDYWDEVSDELKETMPHLFAKGGSVRDDDEDDRLERRREARRSRDNDDDDGDDRRGRGGPPLGGAGRDRQRGGTEVRLDARMVAALDESGIPLTGGDATMIKRRNNIIAQWANKPK